ncbi:hypothetical protein O1M63_46155 [Streptomyces mirabilis]|nr:hypothetical protein [Streptomyces mirabilis]
MGMSRYRWPFWTTVVGPAAPRFGVDVSVRSPIETLVMVSPVPGSWSNFCFSKLYAPVALTPPALRKLCSEVPRAALPGTPSEPVAALLCPFADEPAFPAVAVTEEGSGTEPVFMGRRSGRARRRRRRAWRPAPGQPPMRRRRRAGRLDLGQVDRPEPSFGWAAERNCWASAAPRPGIRGRMETAWARWSAVLTAVSEVSGVRTRRLRCVPSDLPVTWVAEPSTTRIW